MTYTNTWNAAFEASPADGDSISEGAERIRDTRIAIQERMAHDHYFDKAGTDADHGEHLLITFHEQSAPGSPGADKAYLYTKDIDSKVELHYKDEDDNVVPITKAGVVMGIAANTIMLFDHDTARAGWTLLTGVDDTLPIISKGSAAGGEAGGANLSGGTWTQPDHTHDMSDHVHMVFEVQGSSSTLHRYDSSGTSVNITVDDAISAYNIQITNGGDKMLNSHCYSRKPNPTDTAGGATANTWRPKGRVFTRQQKD